MPETAPAHAPAAAQRPPLGTALRTAVVTGAVLMALSACQTGSEAPGQTATPSATAPSATAEPSASATPEPTEPTPEASASPGSVVNGPNTITSPTPEATMPGPQVTATGSGTAFEGTLSYRVLRAGTDEVVVPEGWTQAGANGEIGPWTIPLVLEPGTWTLQVWEADMSDGESPDGPYRNLVEVTFTVE